MMKRKIALKIIIGVIIFLCILFGGNLLGKEKKNEEIEVESGQNSMEVIKKEEASYERWLAAAMLIGISLRDVDFEIEEIFTSTETTLNDRMNSEGVYIKYLSVGEKKCIYSRPLETENKEPGQLNLFTQDLGFSSFEYIDGESINSENYTQIDMDSLNKLIEQSVQVSIYEN